MEIIELAFKYNKLEKTYLNNRINKINYNKIDGVNSFIMGFRFFRSLEIDTSIGYFYKFRKKIYCGLKYKFKDIVKKIGEYNL